MQNNNYKLVGHKDERITEELIHFLQTKYKKGSLDLTLKDCQYDLDHLIQGYTQLQFEKCLSQHNIQQLLYQEQNQLVQMKGESISVASQNNGITSVFKFIILHEFLGKQFIKLAQCIEVELVPNYEHGCYNYEAIQNHDYIAQLTQEIRLTSLYTLDCISRRHCIFTQFELRKDLDVISRRLKVQVNDIQLRTSLDLIGDDQFTKEIKQQHRVFILVRAPFDMNRQNDLFNYMDTNIPITRITQEFRLKSIANADRISEEIDKIHNANENLEIIVGERFYDLQNRTYSITVQFCIFGAINQLLLNSIQKQLISIMSSTQYNYSIELNQVGLKLFEISQKLLEAAYQCRFKLKGNKLIIKGLQSYSAYRKLQEMSECNEMQIQVGVRNNLLMKALSQANHQQLTQITNWMLINQLNQPYLCYSRLIKDKLEFTIYYNNKVNISLINIEKQITTLIEDLQMIQLRMQQFQGLGYSIDQFQTSFKVTWIKDAEQCVGSTRYMEMVKQHLSEIKNNKGWSNYVPKSKLHAISMLEYHRNMKLPYQLKIDNNMLIIGIDNKEKLNAIVQLKQYEQDIQFHTEQLELSEIETEYLRKYFPIIIENMQEQNACQVNLPDKLKKSITQGITPLINMKRKQVFIQYGHVADLTNVVVDDKNLKFQQQINWKEKQISVKVVNETTITLAFEKAHQHQIQKIGFKHSDSQKYLSYLIEEFYKPYMMSELYIMIDNATDKQAIEKQIKDMFTIQQKPKQVWQWFDTNSYTDYDEDVNDEIEKAYQIFKNDNSKSEVLIRFPCTRLPGTHMVNLKQGTIKDIYSNFAAKLTLENDQYSINGILIDDSLSHYIQLKKSEGQLEFMVFHKQFLISFTPQDKMYQQNIETGYKRNIRIIAKQQYNDKAIFQQIKSVFDKENKAQMECQTQMGSFVEIVALNQETIKLVKAQLMEHLNKQKIQQLVAIPSINDEEFFSLISYLSTKSIQIEGDIIPLSLVTVHTINVYIDQIRSVLDTFVTRRIVGHWGPQKSNLTLHQLDINTVQFQNIQDQFKLEIVSIKEIHNIAQWQRYQANIHKLNLQEVELFYGNQQDPQLIYEAMDDAFTNDQYYGNFIRFGLNKQYIDGMCFNRNNTKKILMCTVAVGKIGPATNYVLQPYGCDSLVKDEYYYVKRGRAYPRYEITFK